MIPSTMDRRANSGQL